MKPGVGITLDKERTLRYGMRALIKIEEKLGIKSTELNMQSMGIKELAIMIWAGLEKEDPGLTVDDAINLIDDYSDINTVSEKMTEAINLAYGIDEKKV